MKYETTRLERINFLKHQLINYFSYEDDIDKLSKDNGGSVL